MGYQVNPDLSMIGFKDSSHQHDTYLEDEDQQNSESFDTCSTAFVIRRLKFFHKVEEAGSEISYRCVNCRSCKACKTHDHDEVMSIKEEVEQDIINKAVKVDIKQRVTTARLPMMQDSIIKLIPNKNKAMKVFIQQRKKLIRNPKDKVDVFKSEKKLQELGHVDFVRNLPEDVQKQLANSPIQNFIPWRAVWKENSLSTPCRVVFDASQPTNSGFSLNDIIAIIVRNWVIEIQ